MSTLTQEIVKICDSLPEEKVAAVVKFARALQHGTESPDDTAWERIISEASPRPKFEEFMQRAFADGEEEALDPKRL